MARKVYTKGFEELERAFSGMGKRVTPLMKKAVYAGAGDVANNVRATMQSSIKHPTGDLESGLEINKISTVGGNVLTSVGFEGYSNQGDARPLPIVAAVLDSGRSDQQGRNKTHFFTRAVKISRTTALQAMLNQFQQDVERAIQEEANK